MNNNAKEWVKALRSGEYKQGRGYLRTNERFCCLGVACDLAVEAGVIPPSISDTTGRHSYSDGEFNSWISLPTGVKDWIGLAENSGYHIDKNGKENFLSKLNDRGVSFEEIANLIESEPEGLFLGNKK